MVYSEKQDKQLEAYVADTEYARKLKQGRTIHPQLGALTEREIGVLRAIQSRYDRGNVYRNSFPDEDQPAINALERLTFIRVEANGRLIPSFIYQEHGRKSKSQDFGSASRLRNQVEKM